MAASSSTQVNSAPSVGGKFVDVLVEKGFEGFLRFSGEEDDIGEESVAEAVEGGFAFAFFGFGAAGETSVGSGG